MARTRTIVATPDSRSLSRKAEHLAAAAILLLAAGLRLGWPGLTEFKADEARLLGLALDLAELKAWPWCGIGSSVGLLNSPISVYLTSLPLALPFMRGPIGGVLWVGALNTLAVALCWRLGRRYWGSLAGLTAALLFAAAPWAVFYSRKIWAQNYLPLFTLAYVYAGLLALVEGRPRWLAAHLALLALLIQIHLSAIALIALTGLLLIVFRSRVDRRWLGLGLAAAAVAFLPFLGCWAVGAPAAGSGLALARLAAGPASVSGDSLALTWLVTVGDDLHSLAGPQAFRQFLDSIPNPDPLLWLEGALIAAGLGYWLARALGQRQAVDARAGLALVLWVAVPPLFFVWHVTPLFPHYFLTVLPAPYLAAGAATAALWSWGRARPGWRWAAPGLAGLIAAAQVALFASLLNFVSTHDTPDGFGTPVRLQLAAVDRLADLMARHGADEVLLVAEGDDPATQQSPAVFEVLLRGLPHRLVNGRTTAVLPASASIVIVTPGDWPARERYLAWSQARPPVETIPLRPGEGEYLRLVAPPAAQAGPPPHPARPSLLSNGVEIDGYDWEGRAEPGGAIEWQVWWLVTSAASASDTAAYHFFNHLVDSEDNRWGQQDGASLPAARWRAGDRVVSFFSLPVAAEAPDGSFWVRVGMYTHPDGVPVPVLDGAGNPAGEAVRLGPIE